MAVLFLDFPDAQARHTTRREAALGLPYIERYLETASYGRLKIEFTPCTGGYGPSTAIEVILELHQFRHSKTRLTRMRRQ